MTRILLVLSGIFICFSSCEKSDLTPPDGLPELLFQAEKALQATVVLSNDELAFSWQNPTFKYAFIGVFKQAPQVEDGKLINENDLVWQWNGIITNEQTIYAADGQYAPTHPPLDLAFLQCQNSPYYWAAWGWDETAQLITHSTAVNLLTVDAPLPQLALHELKKSGNAPSDTLLVPGQTAEFQLQLLNSGNADAQAPRLTLTSPQMPEYRVERLLSNIPAGLTHDIVFSLDIPAQLSYGDTLRLNIELNYNDCLSERTTAFLLINAAKACLVDVRLLHIEYLPPSILWDPFDILPILYDPDVYYLLFSPQNVEIHRSNVIDNATDDWPNTPVLADWIDINPCLDLQLDSTYSVAFWDDDPFDDDDFIGSAQFRAIDYLSEQLEVVTIVNDEVRIELHFNWE